MCFREQRCRELFLEGLDPVEGGIWATVTDSAFGAYTPCGIDSVVVCISHLVLLGLCFYRIWLIRNDLKVQRYQLRSKYYNYVLGLLAGYCIAEPLFRLVMGISLFNLEGQTGLAPFEMVSLIIVALAWCSMLVMLGIETGIYIREFRWYVRFGAAYVLVGDAVMLNLILSVTDFYTGSVLYMYLLTLFIQVLFGVFLFVYIPQLDPYPGYVPIRNDPLIDAEYEALLGGEHVCPERDANLFSRICFGWMTPLMRFHICWAEESKRSKPWLLRALNNSLGGRFWFGGLFKSAGVLCEAQYFRNVMRVGFRLRSTLVAAVFRKSLRLTHEGHKKFPSGKITNLMTTDANALQQISQQLHGLWSAPFRISIAMVLLYQQLGAASLLGSLMLALMFPLQ
ncbi:unnamed protein product [Camellia sinensis]